MIPLFKLGMIVMASSGMKELPEYVFNNCPATGEITEIDYSKTPQGEPIDFRYGVTFVCKSGRHTKVLTFTTGEGALKLAEEKTK